MEPCQVNDLWVANCLRVGRTAEPATPRLERTEHCGTECPGDSGRRLPQLTLMELGHSLGVAFCDDQIRILGSDDPATGAAVACCCASDMEPRCLGGTGWAFCPFLLRQWAGQVADRTGGHVLGAGFASATRQVRRECISASARLCIFGASPTFVIHCFATRYTLSPVLHCSPAPLPPHFWPPCCYFRPSATAVRVPWLRHAVTGWVGHSGVQVWGCAFSVFSERL